MQNVSSRSDWYRQPVVWLFLCLLIGTVIACLYMLSLAIQSDDGLVADDYYKRGNEISMDLDRDVEASKRGLSAQLMVGDDGRILRVLLMPMAEQAVDLTLRLTHPTRAGKDQILPLKPVAGGMLAAQLTQALPGQRWLVQLEDSAGQWRLRSQSFLAPGVTIMLKPA